MASPRERNDRRPPAKPPARPPGGSSDARRPPRSRAPTTAEGTGWLWGAHAVEAALANPARELLRVLATPERARAAEAALRRRLTGAPAGAAALRVEGADNGEIAQRLPPGAVHGGIAALAAELPDLGLEALLEPAQGVVLVLDQVTDPQNVGAILRSAAAFGARGVVLQDRHSPALFGALAKAAAGAVDRLPVVRVVNLSRALERLGDAGWRTVGLAGGAATALADEASGAATALVLGSEGEGLRRLVAEHCDVLAAISMPGSFESLNVSAAAAVALYEATRPRTALPVHPGGEHG